VLYNIILLFILFQPIIIVNIMPGLVMLDCDSSTLEAEAGRLRVQGQSGLHIKTLSQRKQNAKNIPSLQATKNRKDTFGS
jgi:hypothetical protein